MSGFELLLAGFSTALQPTNLLFALIGCVLGMLVGVLPGIGPVAGTAILLPITFALGPTAAIIMLAAIYYGAMYGGTITSVLVNVPGEAASAITCLDGYEMAKQGRAGQALAIAAIGSFIGGTVATMGLVLLARPLTRAGARFGPPEFFALMLVGLSLVTGLAGSSLVRALISAVLGLLIAMVGIDPVDGRAALHLREPDLLDGIELVLVAMGLFGVGEVLLARSSERGRRSSTKIRSLVAPREDVRRIGDPDRSGHGHRVLPRADPGLGAMCRPSCPTSRRSSSRRPRTVRHRHDRGRRRPGDGEQRLRQRRADPAVHARHSRLAHRRGHHGRLHDERPHPGPVLFRDHADLVWAVIASFCIGNVILLILNLPLIPLWVAILANPACHPLFTFILGFCVLGAYSINGQACSTSA